MLILIAGRKTEGQAGNCSHVVRANNKRTSREVRNPRPDPNTLTGCSGSGGGPALPEPAAPDLADATHVYKPAPYGECAECGLPAGNRRHLRLEEVTWPRSPTRRANARPPPAGPPPGSARHGPGPCAQY